MADANTGLNANKYMLIGLPDQAGYEVSYGACSAGFK